MFCQLGRVMVSLPIKNMEQSDVSGGSMSWGCAIIQPQLRLRIGCTRCTPIMASEKWEHDSNPLDFSTPLFSVLVMFPMSRKSGSEQCRLSATVFFNFFHLFSEEPKCSNWCAPCFSRGIGVPDGSGGMRWGQLFLESSGEDWWLTTYVLLAGWWFMVVNGCHQFSIFPEIWRECHHPHWRTICFRGVAKNHQPGLVLLVGHPVLTSTAPDPRQWPIVCKWNPPTFVLMSLVLLGECPH